MISQVGCQVHDEWYQIANYKVLVPKEVQYLEMRQIKTFLSNLFKKSLVVIMNLDNINNIMN